MPPIVRNKEPWEHDEIKLLDRLLMGGDIPLANIAQCLGRSDMAVKHATTKIIFQQLLEHTAEEIADRYKRHVSWIEDIVDAKYRIDHDVALVELEASAEEEDTEVYLDGVQLPKPAIPQNSYLLLTVFNTMWMTVSAGAAYYTWLLYKNGFGFL